jgi:signal transduction histidine kinase
MGTIDLDMGAVNASELLPAAAAPVRRWPEHRQVVLATAATLLVVIFVLRELSSGTGEGLSLLYVIPVTLVALELGLLAGVLCAVTALALIAVWNLTTDADLGVIPIGIRGLMFLTVGGLAGRFSDRMRSSQPRQEHLLRSGLDLARLGDVDALAAVLAEHVRRAVDAAAVRVDLSGSRPVAIGRAGGDSLRVPIASRDLHFGMLEVSSGGERLFTPEDRLVVETLAQQAAVAADNHRLLAIERDQAMLHAELERVRRHLSDQLRNAGHILDSHEQERRGIADRLHEEAAQTMAAALLAVGLLERGASGELTQSQLEQVRHRVHDCIVDLRDLAASLRPASLDELGLLPALERISELERQHTSRSVTFSAEGLPGRLPVEVETSTYRVIEEMLQALHGTAAIDVSLAMKDEGLRIVVNGDHGAPANGEVEPLDARLTTTRARLELIGGALRIGSDADDDLLLAEIPLQR